MAGSEDQVPDPAGPGPPDTAPESLAAPRQVTRGTPVPGRARAADVDDPAPAGRPQQVPGLPLAPGRPAVARFVAAGLVVAAVACLVTWSAFASGVGGFNVVVFLIVAAVAVAELAVRIAARLRPRSAPLGPPAPAGPGRGSITRAARNWAVVGIAGTGAVMGFVSLLGGMAAGGCSTNRCSTAIGAGWLVLVVTQVLIFLTALIGAASARHPGQLARAAALGIAGPVLAFAAFGSAADSVTAAAHRAAAAHCRAIALGPGRAALTAAFMQRHQATSQGWQDSKLRPGRSRVPSGLSRHRPSCAKAPGPP